MTRLEGNGNSILCRRRVVLAVVTGSAAGEHPLTSTNAKCQQFFRGNLHSFDQNVNMLALPWPSMKINILSTTFLLSPRWVSRWGGAGPHTPSTCSFTTSSRCRRRRRRRRRHAHSMHWHRKRAEISNVMKSGLLLFMVHGCDGAWKRGQGKGTCTLGHTHIPA